MLGAGCWGMGADTSFLPSPLPGPLALNLSHQPRGPRLRGDPQVVVADVGCGVGQGRVDAAFTGAHAHTQLHTAPPVTHRLSVEASSWESEDQGGDASVCHWEWGLQPPTSLLWVLISSQVQKGARECGGSP